MTTYEIKIGVCGCSNFYHGQLSDQKIQIRKLAGKWLESPIIFVFKEFLIPEKEQQVSLYKSRCHLFLDTHNTSVGYGVGLGLGKPVIYYNSGVGWDVLTDKKSRLFEKYWNKKSPPQPKKIIRGIRSLIHGLDSKRDFQNWVSGSFTLEIP